MSIKQYGHEKAKHRTHKKQVTAIVLWYLPDINHHLQVIAKLKAECLRLKADILTG
jgi:hypothetical protein